MRPATVPRFLDEKIDRFLRKRFFDHPDRPGQAFCYSLAAPQAGGVSLQSNDYLALGTHPHIVESAIACLRQEASSDVMSSIFLFMRGTPTRTSRFEQRLSKHLAMEAGILCQSGYDANVGLLQAIAQPNQPVYVDQQAHMSLWQGIQAASATAIRFRHNDVDDLRAQLIEHGPGIVVVDSVYSVSGSLCPLPAIVDLAEEFGCAMVVDESHSLGTHGPNGEGVVASLGLSGRVHFVTASLAKAFAYRAGFIACAARYVEFLRFNAFPAIFSSTLLEHEVARLDATLDVITAEPQRRERLWHNARVLRAGIASIGYDISNGSEQIIGLRSGAIPSAIALRDAMEAMGVYGSPFWYPATDWRDAVMRLTVNAALTPQHIERVLNALEQALPVWQASRGVKQRKRLRTDAPPPPSHSVHQAAVSC